MKNHRKKLNEINLSNYWLLRLGFKRALDVTPESMDSQQGMEERDKKDYRITPN